jgi:hypothetical protein
MLCVFGKHSRTENLEAVTVERDRIVTLCVRFLTYSFRRLPYKLKVPVVAVLTVQNTSTKKSANFTRLHWPQRYLQVSVHHTPIVAVLYGGQDLPELPASSTLRHAAVPRNVVCKFQNNM